MDEENRVEPQPADRSDKDRVKDLLTEALTGTSAKSKTTLIREALQIVERMH
jgi:hypothetical protein